MAEVPWIELLRLNGGGTRSFGSQARAIMVGWELMRGVEADCIGNVDADIELKPDYYELLLREFQRDPRLGIAGGRLFEIRSGKFLKRPFSRRSSVPHGIQLIRRECFTQIGGYLPMKYGGPDWVAEVSARMNSWRVESFGHISAKHLRPTLSAEGLLKGAYRQGLMDQSLGSAPVFEFAKCLSRLNHSVPFTYAFVRIFGFLAGYAIIRRRQVSPEFVRFLRKEQRGRLLGRSRDRRFSCDIASEKQRF